MIRELWNRLHAILKPASAENGKLDRLDPVAILRAGYHALRRLADQIKTHAERAPYPHMALRLRQIALEKEQTSGVLREKILSLGAEPGESYLEPKSGKNHWERMVQDLEDQKSVEAFLVEQATRLADGAPEIGNLLGKIAADQWPHKEALLDLVARADPQAEQS